MRKTLKKVVVSVMAITTLAVGVTGMNASAYWGRQSFATDAEAYLSVSSTSVYGYTKSVDVRELYVHLYNMGSYTSGSPSGYNPYTTKVTAQVFGNGFTFSNSEHSADSVWLSPDLAVWA